MTAPNQLITEDNLLLAARLAARGMYPTRLMDKQDWVHEAWILLHRSIGKPFWSSVRYAYLTLYRHPAVSHLRKEHVPRIDLGVPREGDPLPEDAQAREPDPVELNVMHELDQACRRAARDGGYLEIYEDLTDPTKDLTDVTMALRDPGKSRHSGYNKILRVRQCLRDTLNCRHPGILGSRTAA